MIRIDYPDPTDQRWVDWKRRAEEKAKELRSYADLMAAAEYEGFAAPEIVDSLYKYPREWLMEAFNGKCAFCESRMDAQQPGDVEHFRPKREVHNDDGGDAQFATSTGTSRKHPGYFWLAYEWSNLLLACNTCNRSAKRSFFPIENVAERASRPSAIAKEKALLINPREEDPAPFLRFEDTGMVIPIGPRGEKCEKMLNLNRDALVDERKQTYKNVKDSYEKYMSLKETDPESVLYKTELEEYHVGKRKFAAQARVAIANARAELEKKLKRLGF